AAGDEGGEVDLAALDELDHGRVVVDVPDRSAQIDLLHHELVHVEVRAVAPDRDVQQHAGGAQRIHQGVQHDLHAGGLERDVRALAVGQGADLLGHVDLGRIQGVIRGAGVQGLLAAQRGELRDHDGHPERPQHRPGEQPDGTRAADHGDVAGLRAGTLHTVVGDGERFDQGGLVQLDARVDPVYPAAGHRDLLRQTAAVAAEADEVHPLGEVVVGGV